MSDVKWIKIVTNIFDDEKMCAIETLSDGYMIEVVWFKILCLAGRSNNHGLLTINDKLAYTDEMLSKIFRLDIGVVQRALGVFQDLGMIEIVDNAYLVANWCKYQSDEKIARLKEQSKERQRRYREKKKLEDKSNVTCNVTHNVTSNVTQPSQSNANCSYILNSDSYNLNLLSNILNNSNYKNNNYILSNNNLYISIKEWMEYKDERKEKYTESGMKKWLTGIVNQCNKTSIDQVIADIDYSISRNWVGVYHDKTPKVEQKVSSKLNPDADLLDGIL